jgi:hypothetical protein
MKREMQCMGGEDFGEGCALSMHHTCGKLSGKQGYFRRSPVAYQHVGIQSAAAEQRGKKLVNALKS